MIFHFNHLDPLIFLSCFFTSFLAKCPILPQGFFCMDVGLRDYKSTQQHDLWFS